MELESVELVRHVAEAGMMGMWSRPEPWSIGYSELCGDKTMETLFCFPDGINSLRLSLHDKCIPGSIEVRCRKTENAGTKLVLVDMPDGLIEPGKSFPSPVWQAEHGHTDYKGALFLVCSEGPARLIDEWKARWEELHAPKPQARSKSKGLTKKQLRRENRNLRKTLTSLGDTISRTIAR